MGFKQGEPLRLIAPLDANGRFCGYDKGYEDYPYVYYVASIEYFENPLAGAVCVKSCPMKDSTPIECKLTTSISDCNKYTGADRYDTTLQFNRACLPLKQNLGE